MRKIKRNCLWRDGRTLVPVLIAVLILTTSFSGYGAINEESGYVNISPERAKEMIDSSQVIILDVRSLEEYSDGHINGSISMPLSKISCESCLNSLDEYKDDEIIVYCKSGIRSEEACEILWEEGFNNVYNLLGGLNSWKEAGYDVETNGQEKVHNCPCENNEYNWQLLPIDPLSNRASNGKGLGCIPEPVGEGEEIPLNYPDEWDWRDHGVMTPVRNQGGCGSCVAFGTLGSFEAVIQVNGGEEFDSSEAFLFFCGCGYCCGTGWYLSSAAQYLYNNGVPDEACFPYQDHNMPCDPCDDWEERAKKPSHYGYVASLSSIKSAIYNHGPVFTSFAVYTDFLGYDGGIYHHEWGSLEGYHCVCVCGYNDDDNYWICKNSWGSGWGESGYFRIGYGECGICDSAYYLDYEVPGLRADANGPYSSKPGKSIQFHGDADGGEPPYSWHWKFGDGDASNQQSPIHVYTSSGTYPVTLTVTDSTGDTDTDRTTATANNPPNKPKKPSGPTSGRTGISYTYSTSATDPDRDRVRYCFNWGTVYITCTNLVESGKTASKSHRWYTPGTYHVKAMTRDENGGRSGWSDCLTVTISSNPPYTPSNPSPQNNATNVYIDTDLRWKGGDPDGDIVYYDVYFKAGSVPSESDIISSSQTETKFDPGILENDTHYFWKIVATDEYGETTKGPIWNFWTGDTIPPEINITRPMNGLYIANKEMMPIGRTIIIGKITIKVNATDASGIDRVEFYIDNESKNNDTATPYEWEWDEMAFFGHSIKVVAYDKAGNTASDEIDVIIFNI